MTQIQGFENIAPFLSNPLVLIGFVVLIFFGLLRTLLKTGIIPPLPRTTGGDVLKQLLKYAFLIALLIILLGFGLEAYKLYKEPTSSEVVSEIKKLLNPIEDIEVTYKMSIPLGHDSLNFYRKRLNTTISNVVSDFISKKVTFNSGNAATGTELTRQLGIGISTGIPDENNYLRPTEFFIHSNSELLPTGDKEILIKSLLSYTGIHFTVYKEKIDPSKYENIFSSQHPAADWEFGASVGDWREINPNLTFVYSVNSDTLIIEARNLKIEARDFWTKTDKIQSVKDLVDTQFFIHPNSMNEALGEQYESIRKELKGFISVEEVVIHVGKGKVIRIPVTSASITRSNWEEDVLVYQVQESDII